MVRRVFRIRFLLLLSPDVNAIILETGSSFVCPDACVRSFTPTVRTLSIRVYIPRPLRPTNAPTIAMSPIESLRDAPRLSTPSFELPRYTTICALGRSGGKALFDVTICHPLSQARIGDAVENPLNLLKAVWYNDTLPFTFHVTRTTTRLRDRREPTCTTNANPGLLRLTTTDTNERHVALDPD